MVIITYHEKLLKSCKKYLKLNWRIIPCDGKRPMVKNWGDGKKYNKNDVTEWLEKYNDLTLGLVLGQASGLIGVDIDGKEAKKLFKKMLVENNLGDLKTWKYSTASGGLRYLFSIPEGVKTKKHIIPLGDNHEELAFMGDGQQTILPPSQIDNIGSYRWKKGMSPKDIPVAPAPEFILEMMSEKKKNTNKTDNINCPDTTHKSVEILNKLIKRCSIFKEDWVKQQGSGLCEDRWFLWISLLANAGYADTATYFSRASPKYNIRSNQRLEALKDKPLGMTKCTTFGCDVNQILNCQEGLRHNKDNEGVIVNSPGCFISSNVSLKSIGIILNEEGNFKDINGNIFSKYILQNYTLVYSKEETFYIYEGGVYKVFDALDCSKELRNFFHLYVPNMWCKSTERKYLSPLRLEAPIIKQMNLDKRIINLTSGILDLETFEILPHSREYFSSVQIPIIYDKQAKCPKFKRFLMEVFKDDKSLIAVVQEIIGYCLTSETCADKAFLFFGKGANGKSVLLKLIAELVGKENISSVSFADLNKSFARADLMNKTVNIVTESEVSGKSFDTEYFKAIVTGDPIRVEIKFGPSMSYSPICKIMIALNSLPYSNDKSDGFLRRIMIIPFTQQFTGKKANKKLLQELKEELPGILNFALNGLSRLRDNDYIFSQCQAVDNALVKYKSFINPFETFLDDCTIVADPVSKITYAALKAAYVDWSFENGHKISSDFSAHAFASLLKKSLENKNIHFEVKKSNGKRYVYGLTLNETLRKTYAKLEDKTIQDMDDFE
ncbi:MAG: phage/plasmid primase, P4 family [Lutisporaceae bacterium]